MTSLATVDSSAKGQPRERAEYDWYIEEEWAVDALLDVEKFDGLIYDPACGRGTILERAAARGYEVHGSDVVDRGALHGIRKSWDYLERGASVVRPDNVICNPPFDQAEEFIFQASQTVQRKAAFLLRWTFWEGGTDERKAKSRLRRYVLERGGLARTYVFANRLSMPPGGTDVKAKGGAVCFGWFVWQPGHVGDATTKRLYRPAGSAAP